MFGYLVILHLGLDPGCELALVALDLLVLLELVDGELHLEWSLEGTESAGELDWGVLDHHVLPQHQLSLRLVRTD